MGESGKLNGYKIRSWNDILSIALIISLFLGVVSWGLKLESELNTLRNQVTILNKQVGDGILPRAEERIESLTDRVEKLENNDK